MLQKQWRVQLVLLTTLLLSLPLSAQKLRTISGLVTYASGVPVEGVNILISGTELKSKTDHRGQFTLKQAPTHRLTIVAEHPQSFMATTGIRPSEKNEHVHIVLTERVMGLPEVDVVAYRSRSPFVESSYSAMKIGFPTLQFPGSIYVLGKRKLEEQQGISFGDALRNISGLSTASAGEPNNLSEVFVSRGFSLSNSRNYFRDGMRYRKVGNSALIGIDRIEFLRGPASSLYGTAEPGGIVNIISSPALYSPRYSVTLRGGSYGLKQFSGDLTGPINLTRSVRYRLNGLYEYADSYRQHVYSHRASIAPKLDIDLSQKTTLGLRANFFSDHRVVDPGVVHVKGVVVSDGDKLFVAEPWAYSKYRTFDLGYTLKHEFNSHWRWHSQFSFTRLSEDRLYFQMKDIKGDVMNRRLAKWDAHIDYYTVQNDLIGQFKTGKIGHQLLLGIEYEHSYNTRVVSGNNFKAINLKTPKYSERPDDIASYKKSTDLVITQNNLAFYAQDYISLSKAFKLLIGSRVDWISETNKNLLKKEETKTSPIALSPRVAITYNPTEQLGLYASHTTSYVPTSGQTKEGKSFEPIRTKQWEVGVKQMLLDNRLMLTVALYHMTKTNILTPDLEDPQYRIQIGEQYSRGVELSVNSRLTRALSLEANYAYTQGEVSKTNDSKIPVGTKLANVPRHRLNIWGSYSVYEGVLKGLSFGGGCFAASSSYGNANNSITLPSYVTFDAFATYKWRNYKLALNVKNISDKRYYLGAQGANLLTLAPVRSIVCSASVSF